MTAAGSNPGWHNDPSGSPNLRYWDGDQWTSATQPYPPPTPMTPAPFGPPAARPLRKPILWRFAWALFFVAAAIVVFLPIKETILGTDQNCGNAFNALNVEVKQEAIDAGIGEVAQNAVDQCHSDAHMRLWIAGILVLAGVGASVAVRKWELSR